MKTQKKHAEVDITTIYIRDDLGHAWYYCPKSKKIKNVLADMEANTEEELEENGYFCDSLEHGIRLLNEFGYITGEDYQSGNHDSVWEELKVYVRGW